MRRCAVCGGEYGWNRAWCSFSCAAKVLLPFPEPIDAGLTPTLAVGAGPVGANDRWRNEPRSASTRASTKQKTYNTRSR
jgi:hypothetical protein